jgi:hypothetical protein
LARTKYQLTIKLDNLKTNHERVNCEMKKEFVQKADNFNKVYTKLSEIYQKLDKGISNIVADFKLLEDHMKDVSDQFVQLNKEFEAQSNEKIKTLFSDLGKIFSQWSVSYGSQNKFFKNDFKFLFKFMDLETQEMSPIYKDYISFKNEYEDFTLRINRKKEELFLSKDYSKWSLAPGTESQLPMFQNNKKISFEKMLYRETFLLAEEKKRVACTIHYLFKQFDKMIKYQSNDLEKFVNNLKVDHQTVAGDAHNLLKLFSMDKVEGKEEEKDKKEEQNKKKEEKEEDSKEEAQKEKEKEKKEEKK